MDSSSPGGRERWKRSFLATLLIAALAVIVIGPPLYFANKIRISLWPVARCFVVERNDSQTFIRFTFEVDGRNYDVTQRYDPYFPLPRELEGGMLTECRYNPRNPEHALIHIMSFPMAIVMFGFSIIPAALVAWWVMRRQRALAPPREPQA